MKEVLSMFAGHSIKLSCKDFLILLFGGTVKKTWSALRIGLWKMPDTDCPCEACRKIFGPLKSGKQNDPKTRRECLF